MAPPSSEKKFKIRLKSGRILGPLDLERIQKLIKKNQIIGSEAAREHPSGEWRDINQISILAELLIIQARGTLEPRSDAQPESPTYANGGYQPILGQTEAALPTLRLEQVSDNPLTAIIPEIPSIPSLGTDKQQRTRQEIGALVPSLEVPNDNPQPGIKLSLIEEMGDGKVEIESNPKNEKRKRRKRRLNKRPNLSQVEKPKISVHKQLDDKTEVGVEPTEVGRSRTSSGFNFRKFFNIPLLKRDSDSQFEIVLSKKGKDSSPFTIEPQRPRTISQEPTIVFQRSIPQQKAYGAPPSSQLVKKKNPTFQAIKNILILVAIGITAHEVFFEAPDTKNTAQVELPPLRPAFPTTVEGQLDPSKSQSLQLKGMGYYVQDTILGYRTAADYFTKAVSLDPNNIKAIAMLASAYLNLIDASEKDETYFSVISKLIEMSKSKGLELGETVIAEVEYFIAANKTEAAQQKIVEYTKIHPKFEQEMFYYIAWVFYQRGDFSSASKYIQLYPENAAFSAKVFYLRGLIAEATNDEEAAYQEYKKGLEKFPKHGRTQLKLAENLTHRGQLKNAQIYLDYLVKTPNLLAAKDLARAYYLFSQMVQLQKNYDLALGYIEKAVLLDRDNHDYIFELYTLRARLGDTIHDVKKVAKMYDFMAQGEKLAAQGVHHLALTKFLEAWEANIDSPFPLVKIGDMFLQLNDMTNARRNYQLASERTEKGKLRPDQKLAIWIKYTETLIRSFDWEEVKKATESFKKIKGSQSAIDRLLGDMFYRQAKYKEALQAYQRAMAAKENIDSDVYISYANALMALGNFKDAPFFFALALRFDPLNLEAVIGTAKCIANAESIDRGVGYLQDELQRSGRSRAELLSAIAELEIQKGEWVLAQQFIDQAVQANPEYANPWRLQALVKLNQEGIDKRALDKALDAYKSYSDRNRSDPSGYLERYKLFIKKSLFDKADDELKRIYEIYPKYPNLHFYKGSLYATMGNPRAAVDEFKREIENNPGAVNSLLGLGKAYNELRAYQEALSAFNKAIQLSPNTSEPRHQAGYTNFLLKNYAGAAALLNSALSFDRGNPTIYKRLGLVYRSMGDAANARSAFKKYLEMEPDAPDRAEFEQF